VAASGTAYVLLGPTASGKSRLAMELAARLPLELVSVDSAQIYRGMDIGTAKPSREERARVPHHLVDIVDPDEGYSAGRWRADAIRAVQEIFTKGRIPLLTGGTMLYYRALAFGLDALPSADPAMRKQLDEEAASRGWPALHAELAKADPQSAARIAPGDSQRIQRALEVWRLTGRPISDSRTGPGSILPFELKSFALFPADRAELHRRIAERFDAMLAAGLIDELRSLKTRFRLDAGMSSMRAVGYRQAWAHLAGEYGKAELREKGIAATRQLAKRQLTWLRSLEDVEMLAGASASALLARIR